MERRRAARARRARARARRRARARARRHRGAARGRDPDAALLSRDRAARAALARAREDRRARSDHGAARGALDRGGRSAARALRGGGRRSRGATTPRACEAFLAADCVRRDRIGRHDRRGRGARSAPHQTLRAPRAPRSRSRCSARARATAPRSSEAARGLALDTALWDQLGCLSPIAVYVAGDAAACRARGRRARARARRDRTRRCRAARSTPRAAALARAASARAPSCAPPPGSRVARARGAATRAGRWSASPTPRRGPRRSTASCACTRVAGARPRSARRSARSRPTSPASRSRASAARNAEVASGAARSSAPRGSAPRASSRAPPLDWPRDGLRSPAPPWPEVPIQDSIRCGIVRTYRTRLVLFDMIRLGRLTDYGIVLMAHLAGAGGGPHTARDIAAATQLPLPAVSKLLKSLAREGLLVSSRGAKGGYQLARPAEQITVPRDDRGARRPDRAHRLQPPRGRVLAGAALPRAHAVAADQPRGPRRALAHPPHRPAAHDAPGAIVPLASLGVDTTGIDTRPARAVPSERTMPCPNPRTPSSSGSPTASTSTASSPTSNRRRSRPGSTRAWCA